MIKLLKIIGLIFGVIIIIFIVGFFFFNRGKDEVLTTPIDDIDLSNVSDGEYIGTFDGYRWSNTVEITVLNNKITKISFVKGQLVRINDIEDELIARVIEKQSLNVDTEAGATASSKAILKAIDNAFNNK